MAATGALQRTGSAGDRAASKSPSHPVKLKTTSHYVANTDTDSSSFGQSFLDYYDSRGLSPYAEGHIPNVEVAIKVNKMTDLNQVEHTFDTEFTLMLDWVDPSLEREKKEWGEAVDWDNHFRPSVDVLNCLACEEVGGASKPRCRRVETADGEANHVTLTQKYVCTIKSRMDLRLYPFDVQYCEIVIKARSISDGQSWTNGEKRGYVQFYDPTRWRWEHGLKLAKDADWLGEWDLLGIGGGPDSEHSVKGVPKNDLYRVQVACGRDNASSMWNMVFILALIIILAFPAFGCTIDSLGDRMGINLTMLLTAMAFKWYLNDQLPNVPYLTVMEKYLVLAFVVLFVQGVWFWVASSAHSSLCNGEHWIFGDMEPPYVRELAVDEPAAVAEEPPAASEATSSCGSESTDPTSCTEENKTDSGILTTPPPSMSWESQFPGHSGCHMVFVVDRLIFLVTALFSIAIHVWLFSFKYTVQVHDFKKLGLFEAHDECFESDEMIYDFEPVKNAVPSAAEKKARKKMKMAVKKPETTTDEHEKQKAVSKTDKHQEQVAVSGTDDSDPTHVTKAEKHVASESPAQELAQASKRDESTPNSNRPKEKSAQKKGKSKGLTWGEKLGLKTPEFQRKTHAKRKSTRTYYSGNELDKRLRLAA